MLKNWWFRFALWLLPFSLSGANFVFVFHGSVPTISIYNADTMELLGTPTVGGGTVKAFGVPDPANPSQFLKFYLITPSTIVVLNPQPPFSVRATLSLTGNLSPATNAAVLTPDGQKLLVAAGGQVHVVNTTDQTDAFSARIATPAAPFGIAVLPNSKRAYVSLQAFSNIEILDLTTTPPQILFTTVSTPLGALPSAIGMAPNGSRLYVAVPGAVYDVDRVSNAAATSIANTFFSSVNSITFDPDPPVAFAVLNGGSSASILDLRTRTVSSNVFIAGGNINKVVLPGANRAFLVAGNPARLYQGFLSAGGAASEVVNPQTGVPFGSGAVDAEASPDGGRLFVAFIDSRLLRHDPSGAVGPSLVTTPNAASGLSLVYSPATFASLLEVYGGNNQVGPAAVTFPATLAVRARSINPAFRQTVTFTSTTSGVVFSDSTAVTNLSGVAETEVQVPVTSSVQVVATVTSGGSFSSVTFTVNGGGTPPTSGLRKVSGDRQVLQSGTGFPAPLVVQGIANVSLAVSVSDATKVSCPSPIATDITGIGLVLCTAAVVTANASVEISMTDSFGNTLSEPFRATIVVSAADLPTGLSSEETELPIVGRVRTTLTNAIRLRAFKGDGSTSGLEVGVLFSSPQDVAFNPTLAIATAGTATTSLTFGCFVGRGSIRALLQAPGLPFISLPFLTEAGPAAQIFKRQGDNQTGNPGQLLSGLGQALRVQVTDVCGNARSAERVTWTVTPTEAARLENVFPDTDFQGQSSVLVRLGTRPGPFNVTASVTTASGATVTAVFTLTVNIVASRLSAVSGNNQTVAAGQTAAQPLVVVVQDANGINVSGVQVTFSVTAGAGTLSASQATTDSQGRASTTVQASNVLGSIIVAAAAAGINQTVTFSLTVVGRVPVVQLVGFVEGAGFKVGWVAGSTGTIFGVGLTEGITGVVAADRAPFPTILRGVRVLVENTEAPIISLVNNQGQEQINIQVPFGIPVGTVTVTIENNGSRATFAGVRVLAVNPGIFEFDSGGTRLAAALHADFSTVTAANPARRGEIILLFLTGLGATIPSVGTNVAGPVPPAEAVVRPIVGINDEGARVLGTFYAPLLYTAYQINFEVPLNARSGLAKLSVVADGVASQDSRIPIQ